ncbi:hypothetical protein [Vulcanisaeta thermophila]|uniref:hypothetical protein n=1 Tax=Vulcanisaeta thermophila TaxID=867917 RepID=UPI0008532A1B|nr:hypothetical protein [Vulcanisaeta thermophila]
MRRQRNEGGVGRNASVICFFCLKKTSNYHIVTYEAKELGMKFRVYACDECYRKILGGRST